MRRGMAGALLSAALVAPSSAAMAHHSFAVFDQDQQVELEGTVREFRFSARIFLDKTNRDILHNEITTVAGSIDSS
jgi:hypothetical protein